MGSSQRIQSVFHSTSFRYSSLQWLVLCLLLIVPAAGRASSPATGDELASSHKQEHASSARKGNTLITVTKKPGRISGRPKIGLALSGGGARGLAHIGVLKALEENRIPIDYIAGTSMGSIIGGLYAIGYSPKDLEWVTQSVDWQRVFRPSIDRQRKNYQQRQEEKDYFVDLEIGLSKKGPASGKGFAGGQQLMLELQRLVGSLSVENFDDFPIPYRAVATDLNAAEPYVMDHGDLAMAMRASMAVPLVFGPVKYQGRMLADGGILDNLPVDVVRSMGADIVIAVNVSSPLNTLDENSSILSATYQSIDVALIQNTIQSLQKADIVIAPDLQGLTATDFEKGQEMAQRGYQAVQEKSLVLSPLALPENNYLAHQDARNFLMQSIPKTIHFVRFSGNRRTATERLYSKAKVLEGRSFNTADIQDMADALAAYNDIQTVTYKVVEDESGNKGVQFQVKEKNWGPDYLKFGLKVADDFDSDTRISVLARHHRYNINRLGGEWINDLSIGNEIYWKSQLYQPMDYDNHRFAALHVQAGKSSQRFYENGSPIGVYDLKQLASGFDVGINLNDSSELRGGLWYMDQNIVPVINNKEFETAINNTVGLRLQYGLDTFDHALFARKGTEFSSEIGLFDKVRWWRYDWNKRFPLGEYSAVHLGSKGEFSDNVSPGEVFTFWGGLEDFAGFPQDSLLGQNAFMVELGGYTRLPKIQLPVFGSPRLIGVLHAGQVWQHNIKFDDLLYGYLAGVSLDVANTVMFLGNGYTRHGDFRFYLRLGTGF
jgi:NTE family protein